MQADKPTEIGAPATASRLCQWSCESPAPRATLTPAGSRHNPSQSQYVIPDVYIVKIEDQYVAVLNEEGLPQLPDGQFLPDESRPEFGESFRRVDVVERGEVPCHLDRATASQFLFL